MSRISGYLIVGHFHEIQKERMLGPYILTQEGLGASKRTARKHTGPATSVLGLLESNSGRQLTGRWNRLMTLSLSPSRYGSAEARELT